MAFNPINRLSPSRPLVQFPTGDRLGESLSFQIGTIRKLNPNQLLTPLLSVGSMTMVLLNGYVK